MYQAGTEKRRTGKARAEGAGRVRPANSRPEPALAGSLQAKTAISCRPKGGGIPYPWSTNNSFPVRYPRASASRRMWLSVRLGRRGVRERIQRYFDELLPTSAQS